MKLEYYDFYDISVYANEHWKAGMTQKELACNAYELYSEYQDSCATATLTPSMVCLISNLWEDIYESNESLEDNEVSMWLQRIIYSVCGR